MKNSDNKRVSLPIQDRQLMEKMKKNYQSEEEKDFFETMSYKEQYEFPNSVFDVIMHENDNEEELYFIKCYNSEYEIGRGKENNRVKLQTVATSLAEALNLDLFDLLGYHMTMLEWFRKRNYAGVRYDYQWEE